MAKTILPVAPVDRLIREAPGAKRVSESAAKELALVLEKYGLQIAVKATALAKHAGRKTITSEDIQLAVQEM